MADEQYKLPMAAATDRVFALSVQDDTYNRCEILASGQINLGSGSAAVDTSIYRNSAGVLKTDGGFASSVASGTSTANLPAYGLSRLAAAGIKLFTLDAPSEGLGKEVVATGGTSTQQCVLDAGSGVTFNGEANHRYAHLTMTGGYGGVMLRGTGATNWDITGVVGSLTYSSSS